MKMPEKLKQALEWLRLIEILLLIGGIAIAVAAYLLDQNNRRDQRIISGWQLLLEEAPGASGKDIALNFLYGQGANAGKQGFFGIDLSYEKHGGPVYLQNVDLYDEETGFGAYAPMSSFAGVVLSGADLRNTTFAHSCLFRTELANAKLDGADLSFADLTYSNLSGVDISSAKLEGANLSGTNMKTTRGLEQSQLDGAHYCEAFGPPTLPDEELSVPSRATCDTSQGCKWSDVWPEPWSAAE